VVLTATLPTQIAVKGQPAAEASPAGSAASHAGAPRHTAVLPPVTGRRARLLTKPQMAQGVPGLIRCQPRLGDFARDLYQQARRPACVLTRGPVVVAAEPV